MLDTMVAPRPGCQPLPNIATFLAGMPQRVATDGFYIPSPAPTTSTTPSFSFPITSALERVPHACTTPPNTPRGLEVAATIAKMGQRVADDGFYIRSPAEGSTGVTAFTFDDLVPCTVGRDVPCDVADIKTPPITPRGRQVALMLTSMRRKGCRDAAPYVMSPLVRDLDVTRQDDLAASNVFSFSDADLTSLMTPQQSLPTQEVHVTNDVTSRTDLFDHHYNRHPLPSPLSLPVRQGQALVADDRKQDDTSSQHVLIIEPVSSFTSALSISPDFDISAPEYGLSPAETAKHARRTCRRPQRYMDVDVVQPVPPTPPRTVRPRRVQPRQNISRGSVHKPSKKKKPTKQDPPSIVTTPTTRDQTEDADSVPSGWSPRPKQRAGRNRKSLPCPMCDRVFTTAFSLRQHANTHTGARPYVCDICNKDFAQVTTLRTHRRLHTGERPYPCRHCDRSYSDYSSWTKHERTHTGTRPYSCDGCGTAFTQSGNLKRHQRSCRG